MTMKKDIMNDGTIEEIILRDLKKEGLITNDELGRAIKIIRVKYNDKELD